MTYVIASREFGPRIVRRSCLLIGLSLVATALFGTLKRTWFPPAEPAGIKLLAQNRLNQQLGITAVGTLVAVVDTGQSDPPGWMTADGRTLEAEKYSALQDRIGNTYGGDAQRFRLPDFRGMLRLNLAGQTGGLSPGLFLSPPRDSLRYLFPSDGAEVVSRDIRWLIKVK